MSPLEKIQWMHKVLFEFYIILDDYIIDGKKNLNDSLAIIINGMEVLKETIQYETTLHQSQLFNEIDNILLNNNEINIKEVLTKLHALYEEYMEKLEKIGGKLVV